MWKLLLLFLISISFAACHVTCRNSTKGWDYVALKNPNDKRASEIRKDPCPLRVDDGTTAIKDSVPGDTVTDPNNITALSRYNDTLFLRRKVVTSDDGWTDYNYVYIEKNRESKYYGWLTSFQFHEYNIRSLESYGITGVTSSEDFNANKESGLPQNWIPLYSFDGKYYIYKPSDFGNAGKRILTDSLFITWNMDGPMPDNILSQQQLELEKWSFELELYDGVTETLNIQLIDEARQMYVFEYPNESERYRYQLYIPADRAHQFDMIVNTGNHKAREYDFVPIDFESLIGTNKQ